MIGTCLAGGTSGGIARVGVVGYSYASGLGAVGMMILDRFVPGAEWSGASHVA